MKKSARIVMDAIDYMEEHLTEKLDLDLVAKAVHYSKYHLHRSFTNTVGLTPHEYQQRRKLTEAAKLLVFSERPVLEIAMTAGYESQQAFTKIFTDMYKMPPARYRENEKFYPLQLRFHLEGSLGMQNRTESSDWKVDFAVEEDIPCWMELVRLVVDGFPYLDEAEYLPVLKEKIRTREALILKDGEIAVGILLFSAGSGSIDFMGAHPLCKKKGISRLLLNKVMEELTRGREISITTYREGDKADTGYRRELKELGFAEAELLVEFGYPTQRFVLERKEEEKQKNE